MTICSPGRAPSINPVVTRVLQSNLDGSLGEAMAIGREPDGHAAVTLPNNPVERNGETTHGQTGDDDERSEHAGQQLVFGILDLGANQTPVQLGIDRCSDGRNLTVEYPSGKRHDSHMNRLSFADQRHVALRDARIQPNPRNIRDGIGCWQVAGLHEVSGRRGARSDAPRDRAGYDQVRIDGASLHHAVDLDLRLAENRYGVARRLECAFRGLLIGNCLLQILLRHALDLVELLGALQRVRRQIQHAGRRDQI